MPPPEGRVPRRGSGDVEIPTKNGVFEKYTSKNYSNLYIVVVVVVVVVVLLLLFFLLIFGVILVLFRGYFFTFGANPGVPWRRKADP